MAIHLEHLNPRQREAATHGTGPLLILAGAGSGKTNTMAHRIAYLIADKNIAGRAILGLSFTNRAASELRERVIRIVSKQGDKKAIRGLTVTTFHSLCARILREHAHQLGFGAHFTILDASDQSSILRQV